MLNESNSGTQTPENTGQPARNAAQGEPSGATHAYRSPSTLGASGSTAGTAAGQVVSLSRVSQVGQAFARSRGLSLATLEALGVASGTAFFPDAGAKSEALFFRYPEGWKARAITQKSFVAGKGFKLAFWNIERVLAANPAEVFICEGELDACALVEAGISPDAVLSVPNGAKERPADAPQDQRGYEYVLNALRGGLQRVSRFVWCGDSDGPGKALRTDFVRILGAARFFFVEWPDGCKDAGDMLRTDGAAALRDLVMYGRLPWPVDGLFRMGDLPDPPPMVLWDCGFPEWESKVRLAARSLSVVTGHPGHGKTIFWNQVWFNVAREYAVPVAIASFETRPKPHLRRQLRTLHSGRLEKDMSPAEISKADDWINNHYLFLVHKDQRPTLEWFLDMAEVAVIRHGARVIQLDPWNRLEAARAPQESETEYIGRCLRTIHAFAHDMNCHVQIVAHPAKMEGARRGQPPGLEDISGSKNWENMVDQGFVVHRPEIFDGTNRKTEAVLYHRKARFEELGYPCKLTLHYDLARGVYKSDDYAIGY